MQHLVTSSWSNHWICLLVQCECLIECSNKYYGRLHLLLHVVDLWSVGHNTLGHSHTGNPSLGCIGSIFTQILTQIPNNNAIDFWDVSVGMSTFSFSNIRSLNLNLVCWKARYWLFKCRLDCLVMRFDPHISDEFGAEGTLMNETETDIQSHVCHTENILKLKECISWQQRKTCWECREKKQLFCSLVF